MGRHLGIAAALFVVTALLLTCTRHAVGQDDKKKVEPDPGQAKGELPKEVIAAWEQAGAEAGWMAPRWQLGVSFWKDREGLDATRTVPAFRFPRPQGFPLRVWPERLATLPAPEQSFGLELRGATDAKLRELVGLKQLTALHLSFSQLTEAGIQELAGMKQLTSLHFNVGSPLVPKNRPFTDADLQELAGMKQLTSLELPFTQVTDAGLKELAGLTQLTSLHLTNNVKFTDAGLKELAGLKQLTSLNLNMTRISDAGLQELRQMKQLTTLGLWHTQVTDAGLKELAGLKRLTSLELGGRQVTEDGLQELAWLKQLTTLYLSKTPVTEAGIEKVREALPKCRISFLGR